MKWLRIAVGVLGAAAAAIPAAAHSEPRALAYRSVADRELNAFVFEPEQPGASQTIILLFHGGGYFTGSPQSTFEAAKAFAENGATAIAIEYRLSDERHTPLDALADACAAIDWARGFASQLGPEPQLVLYGVSAGAHLVANAVTHGCGPKSRSPGALLLSSPGIDVVNHAPRFAKLLRGKAEVVDHAPLEAMTQPMPPLAIVHGEEDRIDPIETSRRLCRQQRSLGGECELLPVPGRGHLLSRNLERQIPGPGFDPDPDAHAAALGFFVNFLKTRQLLPEGVQVATGS